MKLFLLSFLCLFFLTGTSAQNINIPDTNFKQALIGLGIDGGDGEISEAEAEAVTNLDVSNKAISDLSGIGYFTNLQVLRCNYNLLISLDVSGLNNLEILNCYFNQLTDLDVSGLTHLEILDCFNNQLTSLDVSGLTSLSNLSCFNNQLTSLDVSGLTFLDFVDSDNNQLRSVDIRNTPALFELRVEDNPDLDCIVVDDLMDLPFQVLRDPGPAPYTTEPCLATFESLADLIRMADLPPHTATLLTLSLDKAEWLCSTGSVWLVQLTLEGMKQTLAWSARYGQISTTYEEQLTTAIVELKDRIRNGEVDCDGDSSFTGVFDWIFDLFFLEQWEDQQEDSDKLAFRPETTYSTHHSRSAAVFPNPTEGMIRFSTPAEKVVVLDMVGRRMLEARGTDEIDLSGLQAGVYVIRLENGRDVSLHRVVKQQ